MLTCARAAGPLAKFEVVKHKKRGGELQKIAYHDTAGRQVLAERYEGHQLTRLELWEYPTKRTQTGRPTAMWLLVRGNYLWHQFISALEHLITNYHYTLRLPGETL